MNRQILLFFLSYIFISCHTQDNELEKVSFYIAQSFEPDAEYKIDFESNELTCYLFKGRGIIFNKTYHFTEDDSKKLIKELNKDIPDSVVIKGRKILDGGAAIITYQRKGCNASKLVAYNPRTFKMEDELKKITTFFNFAYCIVKDKSGIAMLDKSYKFYVKGLPIRKITDHPLEYKVWDSIYEGPRSQELLKFLDSIPKDRPVIIDCNVMIKPYLKKDIDKLFAKYKNLKFINFEPKGNATPYKIPALPFVKY